MPKSFVEALRDKYCEELEEDDTSNFVVSIVFTNRPRKNSGGEGDAELGYLTSVVLSRYKVTHAGIPSEGLSSLCPNISDLDLSSNLIGCWHEVISILRSLDSLRFVNLSGNNLKDTKNSLAKLSEETFGIENLVLNNTKVSWEDIIAIASRLPRLRELHASQNGYTEIPATGESLRKSLPNLQVLHVTDNKFSRWDNLSKLAFLPKLHTLMLSENPLSDIHFKVQPCKASEGATNGKNGDENSTESTADHKVIVDQIMEDIIHDAINITQTKRAPSSPVASPRQSDPPSYDSGMEDCQQHTPRRERLRSQEGSEVMDHRDQDGLADLGSSVSERSGGNDSPKVAMNAASNKPGLSDISERGVNASLTQPGMNAKDADKIATAQESETKVDVSTNKFAYFEIGWEDEAIGQEMEDKEEGMEQEQVQVQKQDQDLGMFPSLKVLCVTETQVCNWSDLEAVRLFPNLSSLRIKNVPFLKDLSEEERRKLLVASLPNITLLNGSEIHYEEREKSERFFIRHFCGHGDPPSWHSDLVAKHGNLKPIQEINLGWGFQETAKVSFIYEGACIKQDTVRPANMVFELRNYCAKLVKKHRSTIILYHLSKDETQGIEEYNLLNQDLLSMSRYNMTDGDEIHIDTKKGNQDFSVHFATKPTIPNPKEPSKVCSSDAFNMANLSFMYNGTCIKREAFHRSLTVKDLREYCAKLIDKPVGEFRIQHLCKDEVRGVVERVSLSKDTDPLSRHRILDGDDIFIELRQDAQPSSSFGEQRIRSANLGIILDPDLFPE